MSTRPENYMSQGGSYKNTPAKRYHGLRNQGSTCYLNSVLQVLFMTEDFRKAVGRSPKDLEDPIDHQLDDLFKKLQKRTGETYEVTQKLGIDNVHEQRDAAEHLEKILTMSSPEASKIFEIRLNNKTICCGECNEETDEEKSYWNLPLPLKHSSNESYSVKDAIEDFFKDSHCNEDNQLYCETCEGKRDATIKCVINQHPEVLMLLLKRFEFNYNQMCFVKNTCKVDVPFIVQIPPNQTYELYGFVEHFGSLKSGHYTATIRPQSEDRWYHFNDSSVTEQNNRPFPGNKIEGSKNAYLLFYRKKDNSSTSTSGCSRSDQPCRIDIETKEWQKSEEDRFVTNSDRKLEEIDTHNSSAEMRNKQGESDRRSTKVIDNQHNEQHQDLDRKQSATSKPSESFPTGLHNEDSVVSQSVSTKGDGQKKQLTTNDLVVGVQNNLSNLQSDRKELKVTPQNPVDICSRAEVNQQAESKGRESDGKSLESLVDNEEQPHDQQKTKVEAVNKSTEGHKSSQKQRNSHSPEIDQYVEIQGESYKICEIMTNSKNEKYILLKEICQVSREDGLQDRCCSRDCEIYKPCLDHTHFSEEPCTTPPELKRKVTKMHTGGSSESYKGGSESNQETRPENQPGQIITAFQYPNQNQMANTIHSGKANKPFENQGAGSEHNYQTSQSCRDTTHSASGDVQQPLDPQYSGSSEELTSRFQGLTLNNSSEPNKVGDQRVSTKSGTCTGNHQFIDS